MNIKKPPESRGEVEFLPSSWNRERLFALLLVLGTMAAYLPICHAGFIWDDDAMLLNNPLMHQAGGWYRAWFNRAAHDFVPPTITSFWLEWQLWGANPLGYHLDNVLLHVCSALLLWRILLRLKISGAWLAAAIFAVHPVNVESVAWITQRKNTLTMVFFLTAVQWYLTFEDSGRRRWFWLAAGMFLLAMISKTAVVPLPLVLLGLAWWRRGHIDRKDIQRSLVFFALAAAGSLMAIWIQHSAAIGVTVRVDSFWARLAGAGWAVWFYLYKAALPLNLIFVYPQWEIPAGNPLSYLPLILWVAGLVICWRYRHEWGKGALLALGYFSVMLLPVLGFVSIYYMYYSLVADHWEYFAIIGPIALAAAVIRKPVLAAMLLLTLGILTWRQCGMYVDAETLWRTTLERNPESFLAHNNLGTILRQEGKVDEAIVHFQEALKIKPDGAETHLNLGNIFFDQDRLDEALAQYQEALESNPDNVEAQNYCGRVLLHLGRVDEAITHFQAALRIEPDNAKTHTNLGNALAQNGKAGEAIAHFQEALKIEPSGVGTLNNFAWFLATCPEASFRNGDKAVELSQEANRLSGGENPLMLQTLAAAFAEAGRFSEAMETAQQALRLAEAQSNTNLSGKLQLEMEFYQTGKPYHVPKEKR